MIFRYKIKHKIASMKSSKANNIRDIIGQAQKL